MLVESTIFSIKQKYYTLFSTLPRSWQEYTYDDLNRLITASGNFVGRNDNGVGFNHSKYTLAMSYDSQHNITNKIQMHESATSTNVSSVAGAWTQVEQTSYNLDYQDYNTASYSVSGYNYTQPHAPRTIVDQPNLAGCCDAANDPRVKTKTFDYDANGNQTKITQKICTSETADVLRENLWDEENRLRAIDLNPEANTVHPIAIYTYDAGGERIIKQNATSVAIYKNALQVGTAIQTDFMLYPSGMLVARPAADGTGALSYTKHYFAGSQRVSSKIGTTTNLGRFLQDWMLIENSSGGAPINLVSTSNNQLTTAETAATVVYIRFSIRPTPIFNSNSAFIAVPAFTGNDPETEQYFFHPDHLGSSNYITNFVGEVSQHMEYFAFGETFIEEHKNSHNAPYKYNGKELDEESGLYYYGARYYDPKLSIWASVDPLAEQTPNWSPYAFCNNNPLFFTDPTGMSAEPPGDYYDKNDVYLGNDGIDDNKVYQLKDKYDANFNNKNVNWGGELSEKHSSELKSKSNDLGTTQQAFVTGDNSSDKRIRSLHPAIRMAATSFIKEVNENSSNTLIRVAQGFRTYSEQDALYAQGRSTPGNIVTKAKGGFSNHNFGLAFDIVGVTHGKVDYNLDWKSLSTHGISKGFEWGGDWKFKDMPHFQMLFGNSLKGLRTLPKDSNGFPILKQ